MNILPAVRGGISSSGGASPYVAQFYNRLLTPPSAAWDAIYQSFINGLVSDGIWSGLDGLFVLCAADSTTSLVDLTATGSLPHVDYQGGVTGVFTPKVGWNPTGNLWFLQFGYSPSSQGVNFKQNDNSVFCYISQSTSSTSGQYFYELIETGTSTQHTEVSMNYTLYSASSGSPFNMGPLSPETGFFLTQRTSSSAEAIYRNAVLVNSQSAKASVAIPIGEVTIRANITRGILGYGKSLDGAGRTALNNRVQALLTAVAALP